MSPCLSPLQALDRLDLVGHLVPPFPKRCAAVLFRKHLSPRHRASATACPRHGQTYASRTTQNQHTAPIGALADQVKSDLRGLVHDFTTPRVPIDLHEGEYKTPPQKTASNNIVPRTTLRPTDLSAPLQGEPWRDLGQFLQDRRPLHLAPGRSVALPQLRDLLAASPTSPKFFTALDRHTPLRIEG